MNTVWSCSPLESGISQADACSYSGYLKWCVESDRKSLRRYFNELSANNVSDRSQVLITIVDVFCRSLFGLWRVQLTVVLGRCWETSLFCPSWWRIYHFSTGAPWNGPMLPDLTAYGCDHWCPGTLLYFASQVSPLIHTSICKDTI